MINLSHKKFTIFYDYYVWVKCKTLYNCLCSSSFRWGNEFSFLQGIYVRIDIRIDISISVRLVTTKFVKQLHLGELNEIILIKQTLVALSRQDHVTIKPIVSPLPLCLWLPNLVEWWLTLSDFYPYCYSTFWARGLASLRDKLKALYFHYHSAYGHQTWQLGKEPWATSTHNVTVPFGQVILRDYGIN